jgi:hypothetical protein
MNRFESILYRIKFRGGQAYGEQRFPIGQIASGQSPSDIVERAPRIVDSITNDEAPGVLRNESDLLKPEQILRLFCVIFTNDSIGLAIRVSTSKA